MPIPSFAEALWQRELQTREQAGREEGREQLVAGMLRHRFGHDARVPALAKRLAALDDDELMRQLDQAATLDDLA